LGEDFQRTLKPDADLESLMNLIWPLKKRPNRLACAYPDFDSTAVRPTMITVGDSFYWNILNFTPVWDVFERCPYWYYFSTAYFDGEKDETKKVGDLDVLQEVMDADFVMLSYSTGSLYEMSNGFTKNMLYRLQRKEKLENN